MLQPLGTYELTEVIRVMNNHFGTTLIEQMTGTRPAELREWIEDGTVSAEQEARLRTGFEVFMTLSFADGWHLATKAMLGQSPFLADECFIDVIRQDRLREALAAARAQASGTAFG